VDFSLYSPSTLAIAAIYASTAFLKHSNQHRSEECSLFCSDVRRVVFQLLEQEWTENPQLLQEVSLGCEGREAVTAEEFARYQRQFSPDFVESVAMDLVDFFKVFDAWHCGLNQLKTFVPVPFQ